MAMVPGNEEAGEGRPASGLAEAIFALAKVLGPKPEAQSGPGLPKFLRGIAETLLPSVVMFALGYIFIQGIELDLKREEFTASAADKLKTYVESLMTSKSDTPVEKLRATALALGGFGGVAAYPLVSIIEFGGAQRIAAAKSGLEQAGRIAPESTCTTLASVIGDTTSTHAWQTRKAVAEVAGLVGCAEARQPLNRLRLDIAAMSGLTPEQRMNFENAVDAALERVQSATRRRSQWW